MVIVKAKFIGSRKSMGFEPNIIYNLKMCISPLNVIISSNVGTFPDYNQSTCKYNTLDKFFENWSISKISHLEINSIDYNIISYHSSVDEIKNFQEKVGITPDGIIGTNTKIEIEKILYQKNIKSLLYSNMRDSKIKSIL